MIGPDLTRFFRRTKEKGIRLVANSGNQYQQIASFLSSSDDLASSCQKSGAQIHERGQLIDFHHFDDAGGGCPWNAGR
ncbi:hypothetical protein [Streptococcus sp.]|uniref:hypothetical protein n=1 Tax=Streptococcus sp. TaxID=1306 RepID=UPI00391CFE87